MRITVQPRAEMATADATVGAAWTFGPSGTQFTVPATMRLRFPEGSFRPGTKLDRLRLARLEEGTWVPRAEGVQVDLGAREVQGRVDGFSTWAVWADPCVPRTLSPVQGSRSESLAQDDCLFQTPEVTRRSQYFDFSLSETTGIEFAWSGELDFVVGIKEDTEDPSTGTVWGSLSGNAGNGRQAALNTILPAGSYQLYLSGADGAQLGAYTLSTQVRSVAEMTRGRGCSGFNLLVPGTTVTGARLDVAEGDCLTTIQFNPDPSWIGKPLVTERYIVRLLPGERYVVTVTGEAWAPTLTVFSGGQVRAQRLPEAGVSSHSVELVPAALTYYTLEVSAASVDGDPPVVPYSISVSGSSGAAPATVQIVTGKVDLTVPGDTVHARAQVTSGGAPLPGAQVRWETSNPAVATVSPAGVVTAVGAGTATLRGSWGSGIGTATITVDPTKLALRHSGAPVSAATFTPVTLRTGGFSGTTSVRLGGEAVGHTVENGTLHVWMPLGASGPLSVEVEQTAEGVTRTGQLQLSRQAIPVPANPAQFIQNFAAAQQSGLDALQSAAGSGASGERRVRNIERARAILQPALDQMNQLSAEEQALVAAVLAQLPGGGGSGSAVDFSGASAPQSSIPSYCRDGSPLTTRAQIRACAEAELAASEAQRAALEVLRARCRDGEWLKSMSAFYSTLAATVMHGSACAGYLQAVLGLGDPPVERPVIKREIRRYTSGGVRGVSGQPGVSAPAAASQTAPLELRSGMASPIDFEIAVSNPRATDGGIPLAKKILDEVGFLASIWNTVRSLVSSDLEPEVPAIPGGEVATLATGANLSEVRVAQVNRSGVTGELVALGDGLGLRLTGPPSGDEVFTVTIETTDATAGIVQVQVPVRLAAGIPNIENAWLHEWLQVNQDPFCNGLFAQGTNGHSRIRVQLSEPMPATGRFVTTTYWIGGSGSGEFPVAHFYEVGHNLYQIDNYVFCWGSSGQIVDLELQYEAPDGTRTNAFRFRMPRP